MFKFCTSSRSLRQNQTKLRWSVNWRRQNARRWTHWLLRGSGWVGDSSDDESYNSEIGQWHLTPRVCKQSCILLMESHSPSRSNVVKILRECLEVEWEVKKGKKSFPGCHKRATAEQLQRLWRIHAAVCGGLFWESNTKFWAPYELVNWFPPPEWKPKEKKSET